MLAHVADEAGRRFGDRTAYVAATGWSLSYADLTRVSDEMAAGLWGRGVREGDVVALALPSTPECVVAYLAAAKLGAVTAGVNTRRAGPERRRLSRGPDSPRDPERPPNLNDLGRFAEVQLARPKLPEDVVTVGRLPLTAMEKVDRRALAAMVQTAHRGGKA